MRAAGWMIAAGLAAAALVACASKDEAPAAEAPPMSERWVEVKSAPTGAAFREEGEAAPEEAAAVDDLLGALDGSGKDDRPGDLRQAAMEPPPPPPTAAPARPMPKPSPAQLPRMVEPSPDPSVTSKLAVLEKSRGDLGIDGVEANSEGLGGLGFRGTGQGGGGQGVGRIHGLGRIDTGGGKGRGPGAAIADKKKRKARKPQDSESSVADMPLSGERDRGRRRSGTAGKKGRLAEEQAKELAFDVAEEAVADDEEEAVYDYEEPPGYDGDTAEEAEPEQEQEKRAQKNDRARAQFGRVKAARNQPRKSPPRGPARRGDFADGDEAGGDAFTVMLDQLDEKDADGRFIEPAEYAERFVEPAKTLPRMCYFENTYLGGNAAYTERLRRLDDALPQRLQPYRAAALPRQPFDAPGDAGLALTATLDRAYVDQPQRVFLQVGLQGSKRYGWRRPPLDIALVVDRSALDGEILVDAITALSRRLGPQDRLGVVIAATRPLVLGELAPLRDRLVLARAIEALGNVPPSPPGALGAAMTRAGGMLQAAAGDTARIPGTQTVLVLTRDADEARIAGARDASHRLTVQGAVTSVIQLGGSHQGWWQVANAGHGNYHRASDEDLSGAVDDELASIARVIARLLRINVRLAPGVEAIRVVGSRVLGQEEVKQVKAREEATDRNLSKTMGVKADRGEDDDGIQTVIPYFYGGDSHVILLELWVTRPGPVADITLKYKDMVALQNATARVAAAADRVPRDLTPAERRVAANVRGFQVAEGLALAASRVERGDQRGALGALDALEPLALGHDRRMVNAFEDLVNQSGANDTVAEALRMGHDRRIGHSPR